MAKGLQSVQVFSSKAPFNEKIEKSHNAKKKLKEGTFWDFSTSILSQYSTKIEGRRFGGIFFRSLAMPRKTERGPFGLVRYCMLHGKPFWFSSLDQQVQFGVFLKFCRTILATSGVSKKKQTKSHDYSQLFS